MFSDAKTYREFARECARQAAEADSLELRDGPLKLARMWTDAAFVAEANRNALGSDPSKSVIDG